MQLDDSMLSLHGNPLQRKSILNAQIWLTSGASSERSFASPLIPMVKQKNKKWNEIFPECHNRARPPNFRGQRTRLPNTGNVYSRTDLAVL